MWESIFLCAIAFSLGWAIRGTILGGPKGAMLPGVLIGLAMAKIAGWSNYESYAVLAAAGAIGFSFGGEMTYGETLGFTHDSNPPSRYWWGILGTAVKGSVWIGLGGLLIGMAGGNIIYSPLEWIAFSVVLLITMELGIRIFNKPLEPPTKLPRIYFSVSRQESWGGMWLTYIVIMIYVGLFRNDYVSTFLGLIGLLGGALGFPIGQMLQSWGKLKKPFGVKVQKYINWWKVMEFSFGAIAGAVLGWGWWYIKNNVSNGNYDFVGRGLEARLEWAALIIYGILFIVIEFLYWNADKKGIEDKEIRVFRAISIKPYILIYQIIPLIFIATGNVLWAYFVIGPIMIWMVGKKVIQGFYVNASISKIYILVPIVLWAVWISILLQGNIGPESLWLYILLFHVVASGVHLTVPSIKGAKSRPFSCRMPVFILMVLQMVFLFIVYL